MKSMKQTQSSQKHFTQADTARTIVDFTPN